MAHTVFCKKLQRELPGLDAARAVAHVDDVRITAKMDQLLLPLPEGASYLGFIFARAPRADEVVAALRRSHDALRFVIDADLPVIGAGAMRYTHAHG